MPRSIKLVSRSLFGGFSKALTWENTVSEERTHQKANMEQCS